MDSKETPLMKQYFSIKADYPDYILFFRLGDFYEMFDKDAIIASKLLNIALTSRDKKKKSAVPLCGVPYHSAQNYIKRLVTNGLKVAICDQIEDPKKAKGIVKREVTRLVTAGTILESELLNEKEAHFLASLYCDGCKFGMSFLDITTGEFRITEYSGKDYLQRLQGEISRLEPKEIIFYKKNIPDQHILDLFDSFAVQLSPIDEECMEVSDAIETLKSIYKTNQIEGMGLNDKPSACTAAASLIKYLRHTQKRSLFHIKFPHFYGLGDYMILDHTTLMHLELIKSFDSGAKGGTLLDVLDQTSTPMGARCIKDWILHPLLNCESIQKRLDAVEELLSNQEARSKIIASLKDLYDLDRLCGRISLKIASPQNLLALKSCIPLIQSISGHIQIFRTSLLRENAQNCSSLQEVYSLIDTILTDDMQLNKQKAGFIKRSINNELDRLYDIAYHGKKWISALEKKEREKTGVSSLKIGYNKVFGYYIEVTKTNLSLVPQDYIRKQTIVNGERFITEELKHFENEVLGAEEKIQRLEKEIFEELLDNLIPYIPEIQKTSKAIAHIDCLLSLSEVAALKNYTKPLIDSSLSLIIEQGRHPVLEVLQNESPFVPNDTIMDCNEQQLIILTGPNMAGKSTYMRQIALIVLMAQIGSFVPSKNARIGLVDRIFTRVGASDKLSKGQSTFMVEMIETASILNQATQKSLIVLDEIGRGTSTYDGISIAWSIAEYLHSNKMIGARTLFATHYHELTELPNYLKRARNYTIAVNEEKGDVTFLYNVIKGGCDRSYGVHVAQLAGLPKEVIKRAYQILRELELTKGVEIAQTRAIKEKKERQKPTQLTLFSKPETSIIKELKEVDLTTLSPLNALQWVNKWKKTVC